MYHHIPINKIKNFERQINFLLDDGWKFIKPQDLLSGGYKILNKKILLTFDDGFYSNKIIADKILKKYNIKAIFFVPSKFVEMTRVEMCNQYIKKNLELKKISFLNQRKISMNYKDLLDLVGSNHFVGAHTRYHSRIATIASNFRKRLEIGNSINCNKLYRKIFFFAFPFGGIDDFDAESIRNSLKKYKYTFLAVRGNNLKSNLTKKIIFRDNFNIDYDKKMCISVVNGFFDFLYLHSIIKILKKI